MQQSSVLQMWKCRIFPRDMSRYVTTKTSRTSSELWTFSDGKLNQSFFCVIDDIVPYAECLHLGSRPTLVLFLFVLSDVKHPLQYRKVSPLRCWYGFWKERLNSRKKNKHLKTLWKPLLNSFQNRVQNRCNCYGKIVVLTLYKTSQPHWEI